MEYTKGISFPGKGEISPIVISTAFGTDGGGIFPYTLWPSYRKLLKDVGLGATVITKSITYNPKFGNYGLGMPKTWRFVQEIKNKFLMNVYGLANKGIALSLGEIAETMCDKKVNLIPSFYPEFSKGGGIEDILESIRLLILKCAPLWAIELNFFCSKSEDKISENMRLGLRCVMAVKKRYPELIVIAKTSIVHPFLFYRQLEDTGVDVIHGFNIIPFELAHPTDASSWSKVDKNIFFDEEASSLAKKCLVRLREATSLPLIMGWGGTSFEAVDEMFDLGANAVSLCTLALTNPEEARAILLIKGRVS